jgi:putative two-component system response regulator
MTKILIVDDEEDVRLLLEQILEKKGYTCVLAVDAGEARGCLKEHDCDLVLCDINMPGESGLELIRDVSAKQRDVAVVMVTGIDDPVVAESVFEVGVFDYVAKPIRRNRILRSVANALRRRELEIANRAYREDLERMVAERTSQLKEALDGIIHAIASTVEIRDPYTAGHQLRVAGLAFAIAREMGFSKAQAEGVRVAGTIHDLGKISVPAEILSRPGLLTEMEFEIIKTHPQAGYDILKDMKFPWPLARIVLQHHERMDGSGYPQGLSGENTLMEARILAVADVVEAMASHRPYRPALGIDVALKKISKNKGVLYDPEVVDACLKVFTENSFRFE